MQKVLYVCCIERYHVNLKQTTMEKQVKVKAGYKSTFICVPNQGIKIKREAVYTKLPMSRAFKLYVAQQKAKS